MRDVIKAGAGAVGGDAPADEIDENQARQAMLRRVEAGRTAATVDELHTAHRLVGRTLVRVDGGGVAVRLDTSFDARCYESHYLLFERARRDNNRLVLVKHTVPYFVPTNKLADKYLKDANVDLFLDQVSDFCNALVSRRQQCMSLKANGSVASLNASDAYDFVQLRVRGGAGRTFDVYAVFDNLQLERPTRVELFERVGGVLGEPGTDDDGSTAVERPELVPALLAHGRLDDMIESLFL
eukprot:TRINITY_DN826_c0_g1_i6.p1 TRINITY_DN826_c0_g1~~TRINITY_DN826_c0_g1_i6.p1  ORF type:complete len:240 (+),score=140.27 TRINITY_DN826_c0_g1_i6:448-1167(+)